jgi:predicted small lipoprotein YifL
VAIRPSPGRMLAASLCVAAVVAVPACGQKGPLYMPDKAEKVELDESDPEQTDLERTEEKKSTGTGY